MRPLLAISMGDVNGIGPEILAKVLARPEVWQVCAPCVFGSADVLNEARRFAPDCPPAKTAASVEDAVPDGDCVPVMDAGLSPPCAPGTLDAEAGRCAMEWVKLAARHAIARRVAAIVTCPINKEGVHRAGYPYAGHTELLAEMTSSPDYRMCLFSERMRIVHISSHLSLRDSIAAVRTDRVATSIRIGAGALARLGLPRRRIAVAGLNPHAGEAGVFGDEEVTEIAPAIRKCLAEGLDCSGPYPPDTVFRRMYEGEFDLAVAMYHDQGHGPFKMIAMDEGVNVTLGLPIIRTSVDHGTAYGIAGKGVASDTSLLEAIKLAVRFADEGAEDDET